MAKQAAGQPTFDRMLRQVTAGRDLAPVYVLHGEEAFCTDRLVEAFAGLVPESDRDFNLYMLYAPEAEVGVIHETCRRFPMMAERQVVIVKECQAVPANDLAKLATYLAHPSPTTLLVLVFRGDKAKGRELLAAARQGGGVVWESKKLAEAEVTSLIGALVKRAGLGIEPKGMAMLRDHIGTDMSRLYNEVNKLTVCLPAGATITPEAVERHVGVSKDYNNFELTDALAKRDAERAYRIIHHFAQSPKQNPFPVTMAALHTMVSNMVVYHFLPDKSPSGVASAMGLRSTWHADKVIAAASRYTAAQAVEIMHAVRRTDAATKGVGSRQDPYDLMHDLVFTFLTATGRNA